MLKEVKKVFIYSNIFMLLLTSLSNKVLAYEYESPLFEAVKSRNLAATRNYINSGYAINIKDSIGNTPLTYAIRNGDYDIMISLLQAGADPSITDGTRYPIYCTAQVSGDDRIRLFFSNFDTTKCAKVVRIKRPIKPLSNNQTLLSSINWGTVGGTALTLGIVGGIAAAAGSSGGSKDNNGGSTGGDTGGGDTGGGEGGGTGGDSGLVQPEPGTVLTPEQMLIYESILAGQNINGNNWYSGYTFSVPTQNPKYSNTEAYKSVNVAYAWARGFDGSINKNSVMSPANGYPVAFEKNPPIDNIESHLPLGTNIQVAVLGDGIYSNSSSLSNNIASASGLISPNQLYEYYNDNCTSDYCFGGSNGGLSRYIKCENKDSSLTCNLYSAEASAEDGGSLTYNIVLGTEFTLSPQDTNPVNTDSVSGTSIASLIVGNPYQLSNGQYSGMAGIAPNAQVISYVISADLPTGVLEDAAENITFDSTVGYKYIGNAFLSAAQNGVVAIDNGWASNTTWNNTSQVLYDYLTVNSDKNVEIFQALDQTSYELNQNYLYYYYADEAIEGGYKPDSLYNSSTFLNNMITAVNNYDSIFVFAADNNNSAATGQVGPSMESMIPLFLRDSNNKLVFQDETTEQYKNFITVVAYDNNTNSLASYSNKCGVAKKYCLTAPGTDLIVDRSTITSTNQFGESGTNLAAAIVSGSIALLKSAYPYLTGAQITQLLFVTAQDLGAKGPDDVYGWGMIDLEAATRPHGLTVIPGTDNVNTASLSSYSLTDSKIKLNSLIANTIKSEDLNLVVLDSFNRTFNVKLNDFIESEKDRVNTIDVLNNFATENKLVSLNKEGGLNLYYAQGQNKVKDSLSQEMELSYNIDNNSTNNTNTNTYGFSLYYGNNPYNAFIDNKVDFYNNFTLSNSYNYNALNPYFKTNSNNNFAFNNIFKLNDTTTLNLGVLTQNYTINYDKYYYDNNNGNNSKKETEELGNALSFLAGLDYNINNNLSTKLELGFINESETLFGSQWSGAFDIGDNNTTYLASVSTKINLSNIINNNNSSNSNYNNSNNNNNNNNNNKLSLIGKLNFGYTDVNSVSNSLIKDISTLYTNSYAIGLTYNFDTKLKGENSNISFLISQPVNIQSGSLNISLPTSRDNDGNIYYTNYKIDLDKNKETNYQLTYNYSLNDDTAFNLGAIYRDYVQDEVILLLKYRKKF